MLALTMGLIFKIFRNIFYYLGINDSYFIFINFFYFPTVFWVNGSILLYYRLSILKVD